MENREGEYVSGLVSIAIPAYKSEFLSEAIDSALTQDYKNIELIIVNDKSPYDIEHIVRKFDDSRIHYYVNDYNLGQESIVLNWNKCLSYARGEYFVLLCDDDILMPNFVSELLKLVRKYPQCNVFHARKIDILMDGNKRESPVWPEYEDADAFLYNQLAKKRHHTITEFLYRTEYIRRIKFIVFPSGFYSDDASIIQFTRIGGIATSEDCLIMFRYSSSHITSNTSPKNCYGKFLASLAYWHWIHQYSIANKFTRQIDEDVQCTIYNNFIVSPLWNKIKILFLTPNKILPLKLKIGFLCRMV